MTNDQIFSEQLPSISDVTFEKLHPKSRQSDLIFISIFMFGFLIVYIAIGYFFLERLYQISFLLFAFVLWLLLFGFWIYVVFASYRATGYALREHDLLFKSGIWYKSTSAIPFNRIQHCEISHGPIDRIFGLSSITIFTAGGGSSDIEIEGLGGDIAYKLKQYITGKVGLDEEE